MANVGLNQRGEYSITGVSFHALDKLEPGGGFDYENNEVQYNQGVGGQAGRYRQGIGFVGNAESSVQNYPIILAAAVTVIGALPPIIKYLQGGLLGNAAAFRRQEDCVIRQLELSCEVGGVLMSRYEWMALDEAGITLAATAAAAQSDDTEMAWHAAAVTLGGLFECQRFRATLRNEMNFDYNLDAAATLADQRKPAAILPGSQFVDLEAELKVPLGLDITTAFPTTIGFRFTGVNNNLVPETFVLDLGTTGDGLDVNREPIELYRSGDVIIYRVEASAKPDELGSWQTSWTP